MSTGVQGHAEVSDLLLSNTNLIWFWRGRGIPHNLNIINNRSSLSQALRWSLVAFKKHLGKATVTKHWTEGRC